MASLIASATCFRHPPHPPRRGVTPPRPLPRPPSLVRRLPIRHARLSMRYTREPQRRWPSRALCRGSSGHPSSRGDGRRKAVALRSPRGRHQSQRKRPRTPCPPACLSWLLALGSMQLTLSTCWPGTSSVSCRDGSHSRVVALLSAT